MMSVFSWTVYSLDYHPDTGVVDVVHWGCSGEEGDLKASSYGSHPLPTPTESAEVVVADDLTADLVLGWCFESGLDKSLTESQIQISLDALSSDDTEVGLPWVPPLVLTHAQHREKAELRINAFHAKFMHELTDHASPEERDTWPVKVIACNLANSLSDEELTAEVAKIVSGSPNYLDDLDVLVSDVGTDISLIRELCVSVLYKAKLYKKLVGLASRVRREAKIAAAQATDPSVPIEEVPDRLAAMEVSMGAYIETQIAALKGS